MRTLVVLILSSLADVFYPSQSLRDKLPLLLLGLHQQSLRMIYIVIGITESRALESRIELPPVPHLAQTSFKVKQLFSSQLDNESGMKGSEMEVSV